VLFFYNKCAGHQYVVDFLVNLYKTNEEYNESNYHNKFHETDDVCLYQLM
jgi:hypothetical protein